jgi:hypothetical protein
MTTEVGFEREGTFRLGGIAFGWWSLGVERLNAWRFVSPDTLGAPDPAELGHWAEFFELAATKSDDDDVRVLSRWSVFQPEFEWPGDAQSCGCLEANGFVEVVRSFNGDGIVPSPGPVFDRFLIKSELIDALAVSSELGAGVELPFNNWARVVGVDHAYFAPGFPDLSAPTNFMRQASQTHQSGEAHEAYVRAFDAYYFGGLPSLLAEQNKVVYLDSLEAERGYSYDERDAGVVTRRVHTINSMRVRKSFCHTMIEPRGAKIFASRLERIAEATSFTSAVE